MECENCADTTDEIRPDCMTTEVRSSSAVPDTVRGDTVIRPGLDGTGRRISRENSYVVAAPFVVAIIVLVVALVTFELGAQDQFVMYTSLTILAVVALLLARHLHFSRSRTE